MEKFISELTSKVDNCKTDKFGDFNQFRFSYNGQNYLLQHSKDKIDWLLKSENETFNYNVETIWSEEMVYLGKKDNSILPKNFNIENVSISEFLGQLISFKS
jgi:hypothetical protein